MKVYGYIFLGIFLLHTIAIKAIFSSLWSYENAVSYAQQGEWHEAQNQLGNLMRDFPDRPDVIYDCGVASYRLSEFEKAAVYFENVTHMEEAEKELKKQAFFNLGNTKVALNKLEDAVTHYQEVLAIDPNNEPAMHNVEKVKEMLKKEQEKQERNKEENKSSDKKNGQKGNGDELSGSEKQEQSQTQQKNTSNSHESAIEKKEKQRSDKQQKGEHENRTDNKSNQQQCDNKQDQLSDTHTSSSQKKSAKEKYKQKDAYQGTKNDKEEQGMQTGMAINGGMKDLPYEEQKKLEQKLAPHERWMMRVLSQQEKADEQAHKKVIKAQINNQLAGHDGQNCW